MKNKPHKNKVVASSVTGPYHRTQKKPCQDCFGYRCQGQKLVAVVSDGAGSAKYGKIGAKTACETLCDILIKASFLEIRQKIIDALDIARQKLILHRLNKLKNENGMLDFAATIVGVVYYKNKGIFFHIGDGAAVALTQKPGNNIVISQPENGIFSCETYFYTMDDWKDSLRFTPFEKAANIMIMSDGVTNFAFKNNYLELEKGFIEPINQFLNEEPNKSRAIRALNNTLGNARACQLNPDDKTFLWAKLK